MDNAGAFGSGFRLTLELTLLSFAGALAIGLVIASMRVSPVAPLRAAGTLYVETIRNIPLLVLMFLFFFGFPKIGIQYPPFSSAVIVLAVYTGAFMAEAIRSGVNTVASGQAEAARAIGLTFAQSMRLVVLPQALRAVVAPIGNIFVALIKNTALALTISVMELGFQYQRLITVTAQPIPISIGIVVCYLALALSAGWLFSVLEHGVAMKR
ncbi:MAG: glutamate transport system permease protein [Actinomycetota bacterium]|nr:glutamate transport system permease protein [Actinomycetota bacterium]